jgi:hypothetical protein
MKPEAVAIIDRLEDSRLKQIGLRLIFCEQPSLLPEPAYRNYNLAIARRLLDVEAASPWLSVPKACQEIEILLGNCAAGDAIFLQEHHAYLSERRQWATEMLK